MSVFRNLHITVSFNTDAVYRDNTVNMKVQSLVHVAAKLSNVIDKQSVDTELPSWTQSGGRPFLCVFYFAHKGRPNCRRRASASGSSIGD